MGHLDKRITLSPELAAELRRFIQEGIDSGLGRYASIDEIKREARRRFEQVRQGASDPDAS